VRSLITGVGGFAGQHLAAWLLSRGEAVSGVARGNVRWHVSDVASADRFELLTADLTQTEGATRVLELAAPDRIYHLAAQSFVPESFADPLGTFENNTASLINMLEAMRARVPEARVLVVSSSEVYGRTSGGTAIDEDAELRPESPYAVSKAAIDLFAYQYRAAYGLDIVRVRPFNHIGPGQSERFVASSFARQIADIERGDRPPVIEVGNLDAMRDFTDVRDMVRAYELAVLKGEPGAVYNIGRGSAVSIGHLLETMLKSSGVPIEVRVNPSRLRQVDAPMQVCDPRRFRERTQWAADIPLDQTLKDTLDHWRARVTAA
jgi:GDP-4-dehydro-6-deoxy-D-mannose reductase